MRIRIGSGLLLLNLVIIALILIIIFSPSSIFRAITGFPIVLFAPGYALVTALFTNRSALSSIERIGLSFGLSIAIASFIGLILNYTPLGITLESVTYSLAGFVLILSLIAELRRIRLPEQEKFSIELVIKIPGWDGDAFNKLLSTLLVVSIIASFGALAYAIVSPKTGERFTEFYILGYDGEAHGYPAVFIMEGNAVILVEYDNGETRGTTTGGVIAGIVNNEHEEVDYSIKVLIDGGEITAYLDENAAEELGQLTLGHAEKWEHAIFFTPEHIGNNQKVEFILYRDGMTCFEESLHLWIDVSIQD